MQHSWGMTNLDVIRQAMEAKDLKLADLARLSGIHAGLLGRYLAGKSAIGLKNAPKLADALGLTRDDVLFGRSIEEKLGGEAA